MILLIILVLAVGGAAAYVGLILPNKPINVLKQSLANSLQAPQSSFKGNLSGPSSSPYKIDFSGATDTASKAMEIKLNLTVTGLTFPLEARVIKGNVYVKAGDLSTVADLISLYSPQYGGLAKTLSKELSNKWIVIDNTLLGEGNSTSCLVNTSLSATDADVNLLNKVYDSHAFVTIKSTGSDQVNGQNAEKFVLSIDNDKLAAVGNDKALDNLSLVKALDKCDKNTVKNVSDLKGNHKQTPLTVWVDKGAKRIVKVAYEDPAKKNSSLEVTFSYGKVSITAPPNAEPAIKVLTEIQKAATADPALLNLFTAGSTGSQ